MSAGPGVVVAEDSVRIPFLGISVAGEVGGEDGEGSGEGESSFFPLSSHSISIASGGGGRYWLRWLCE